MQVISASRSEWIAPFTGLEPGQFRKLVRVVAKRGGEEIADGRPGRQWRLDLADRVLLVAAYWRTNLTMRQLGPLSGVQHSAAHRVIDKVGPLLALAPVRKRRIDSVAIVDGTLVPTRDHRLAAPSKNDRYSANVQVAIAAATRLVIATGDPQPGNRNDCTVHRSSGIDQQLANRRRLPRQPGRDHAVSESPTTAAISRTGRKTSTPHTARPAPGLNTP